MTEIVSAIAENQEKARNGPGLDSGAGNRKYQMEFFCEDGDRGGCSSSRRRCEEIWGKFSVNEEKSQSLSEALNKWSEHHPEVEGQKDSSENESQSVYQRISSRRCKERYREFEAIGEKLKSVSEDVTRLLRDLLKAKGNQDTEKTETESNCKLLHLGKCEEKSGGFKEIGEGMEPSSAKNILQVEWTGDPAGFHSWVCKKFPENGENSDSVTGDAATWSENHLEVEQRKDVVDNQFQEKPGTLEVMEEKLVSLSGDAKIWSGNQLGVEGRQDDVGKVALQQSVFMIQDSERCRNFSDIGENSDFVSKDGMKRLDYQLEVQRKQDAVDNHLNSEYEIQDSRRSEHEEVEGLGLDSEALNCSKKTSSRSFKRRLGDGLTEIKEKQDRGGTELGPILEAQKDSEKIAQDEMKSVSEGGDSPKKNNPANPKVKAFSKISGFSETLGIKVDPMISKSQNAAEKLNYWRGGNRSCLSHANKMQGMRQAILTTCSASSSKAGSDNGMNERGSNASGRSREGSFYENSKLEMVETKAKYRRRKGMRNGSEVDGKQHETRSMYVMKKKGEMPKRRYSRSKLERLRYMNVGEQKKRWNEICQGLPPAVARELHQIAANRNQKQGMRNADQHRQYRKKIEAGEFSVMRLQRQRGGLLLADRLVCSEDQLPKASLLPNSFVQRC